MMEIIYKDLTYKIIGILYDVHNKLGGGHKEVYYQRAIQLEFDKNNIQYKKELYSPLTYDKEKIGKYYLDFLIEKKIILEIKKGERFNKNDIDQVYRYLQTSNLKLGILANFTRSKVRIKRIVNLK